MVGTCAAGGGWAWPGHWPKDTLKGSLFFSAERTKKGVPIPLPEGMDFTKEIVTSHVVRVLRRRGPAAQGPTVLS